jgi:large subunit ribosomal protein L1
VRRALEADNAQAVEVSSPNSLYELTVKTAMPRGTAVPKGRISLPREPKVKTRDRILVFAEGRTAEEARRAGAEFVGGVELAEGVCSWSTHISGIFG